MDEQNNQQMPPQSNPQPQGSSQNQSAHGFMGQIENFFDEYLVRKAPFHLPENIKEILVKIAPWITIVIMVLTIPLILAALGLTVAFAPAVVATGQSFGALYWIGWILTLGSIILEIMSIKGLLHRKIIGWRFVYWAMLLSIISNILYVSIGGLIGNVIGLYILFQVKSKYH